MPSGRHPDKSPEHQVERRGRQSERWDADAEGQVIVVYGDLDGPGQQEVVERQ